MHCFFVLFDPLLKFYQHYQFDKLCLRSSTKGWTYVRDSWKGSYAYKGKEWVAYDDRELIIGKALFVREHNLLGVALSTIGFDDPDNSCGNGKFPMLAEVNSYLNFPRKPKSHSQQNYPSINVSSTVFVVVVESHQSWSFLSIYFDSFVCIGSLDHGLLLDSWMHEFGQRRDVDGSYINAYQGPE